MGILRSKAASPPINPPSTHELRVLPYQRTTAAPAMRTSAAATAFIEPGVLSELPRPSMGIKDQLHCPISMQCSCFRVYQTLEKSTRGRARDESHKHKIEAPNST